MKLKKVAKSLSQLIEEHYFCHGVHIKLRLIHYVWEAKRFIFQVAPKPGTKIDVIFERAADVGTAIQMPLFYPFKDGVTICLAVSYKEITENSLWEMLGSQTFRHSNDCLPIALGYNIVGSMVFADLAKMPHAMYAGATNSGKSFGLVALIMSLLSKQAVNEVNFILFDIGGDTMELFDGIPHLSHPIIKDLDTGRYVIGVLFDEMERRIDLGESEVRHMPSIVCIMDEYVSFINNIEDKMERQVVENEISNILRRGRKAKVHMVLATQDPKVKSMRVDIDNITSRMAFKCAKYQTSINILNRSGAEKLPGRGAMLHISDRYPEPTYIQGAYMPPDEVRRLIAHIKTVDYDMSEKFTIPELDSMGIEDELVPQLNELPERLPAITISKEKRELASVILWVLEHDTISVSQIKLQFSMGNRANGIMDKLGKMGLVSEKFANQPRKVLARSMEDIPQATINFLENNGFSAEEISVAINKRGEDADELIEPEEGVDPRCE